VFIEHQYLNRLEDIKKKLSTIRGHTFSFIYFRKEGEKIFNSMNDWIIKDIMQTVYLKRMRPQCCF